MFQQLPYRSRVPLLVSLIVLLTGLVFTLTLGWLNYEDIHRAVLNNGRMLATIYSKSLVEPLKHRDVWRAYTLIRDTAPPPSPRLIVLLDRDAKTFVSNRPQRYPLGLKNAQIQPFLDLAHEQIRDVVLAQQKMTLISYPVGHKGNRLGQLLLFYPHSIYVSGIYQMAQRITLVTALLLVVLVPVGWLAGRRLSRPLSSLSRCLERLEKEGPVSASCELPEGKGEMGLVGRKLRDVLNQLVEKAVLEKQMINEERLAAIGRLSAGVAHEVNNPLAGMMTALDTFKHHGTDPRVARETVELLERGLAQIHQTVSVLLVQSRRQDRDFSPQDVEDIRTLLMSDLARKSIRLYWHNELPDKIPLPASDLRQILMNLMINAVQATPKRGIIFQRIRLKQDWLSIEVANEGKQIPEALQATLFEPFSGFSGAGTGLGLWVIAQLSNSMKGKIDVFSDGEITRFIIHLPIEGLSA